MRKKKDSYTGDWVTIKGDGIKSGATFLKVDKNGRAQTFMRNGIKYQKIIVTRHGAKREQFVKRSPQGTVLGTLDTAPPPSPHKVKGKPRK